MAKVALIDPDNTVRNVIVGDPADYDDGVDATGSTEAQPGATYDPDTVTFTAPPAPPKSWADRGSFLREFTRSERNTIRSAAGSDSTIDDFLFMLDAASSIRADDSLVTEGMQYLVDQGHLTATRRDEILGA